VADLGWTEIVGRINADFAGAEDQAAGGRLSRSDLVEVFLAERGRLKRIVAGMGLDASDGEDILQDVSIRVFESLREFKSKAESVRWLIRVTVNRCLMEHRGRRSFRRAASQILKRRSAHEAGSTAPDDKAIRVEELELVRETLQKLDGSLLGPLVLRYFCDLNSTEIGQILELKQSTVRSRLRDARLVLARQLMRRGVEP
jgi:RNA polymerase sigma factor (sigma-70 family)